MAASDTADWYCAVVPNKHRATIVAVGRTLTQVHAELGARFRALDPDVLICRVKPGRKPPRYGDHAYSMNNLDVVDS